MTSSLKKILVTGATGSLGLEVCRSLSKKGYQLVATGRNAKLSDEFKSLNVIFKRGDLTDAVFVDSLFADVDHVIHCAALTSPLGRWKKFYLANVVSTKNIVEAAKKYNVKRVIHLSTPSIYYNGKPRLHVKESEVIPAAFTNYAKSKLMAEELVEELEQHGVETIILRPRAIFGPNDQVLLPRILRLMHKGFFPLFNSGKAVVDMTYIDNVIDAIELSLNAPAEALYKKYNITNGEPRVILSIFKEIEQGLGLKVKYIHVPLKPLMALANVVESIFLLFNINKEPALSQYSIGLMSFDHTLSIEEAKKYLNYHPKTSISEGLKKTLVSWKK